MIIVRLSGGLGNQMFQYAFGKALAMRRGLDLKIDVSRYGTEPAEYRRYQLGGFDISADIVSPQDMRAMGLPPFDGSGVLSRLRRKLFRMRESRLPLSQRRIVMEPRFTYCQEVLDVRDGAIFIGDWQSEKYFDDVAEDIRKEFSIREWTKNGKSIRDEIMSAKRGTPVSLHVRRGDNVSRPQSAAKYGTPSTQYYLDAAAAIAKTVKDPAYYIFTDDVPWVEENLASLSPRVIVSDKGATDAEEIVLMSLCKHHIISNSTFSWWGAWLNPRDDKTVIAPKRWFRTTADTSDLFPGGWIRM